MSKKHKKEQKAGDSGGLWGMLTLKKLRNKPKVAVVRLSGVISTDGMFKQGLCLESCEEVLEKAFEMSGIKAVAIQINSPGGSPVQSDIIHKRIRDLAAEKDLPVYTFVEDAGASGGYWLACSGDKIYARPSSLVGSIGVIASTFGFVDAIKKIGVERRVYTQGKNKSILDPFKPERKEDVDIILNIQKRMHADFIAMVKLSRGKRLNADDDTLFNGDFWVGTEAKELGLVDEVGELREVMRDKYGKKVKLIKVSKPKGFFARRLGMSAAEGALSSEALVDALEEKLHTRSLWARLGM